MEQRYRRDGFDHPDACDVAEFYLQSGWAARLVCGRSRISRRDDRGRDKELYPSVLPGKLRFIEEEGRTYVLLRNAGLNVIEVAEYTKFPEMKTGLVKSLHPRIHAGILGHIYTEDDAAFLQEHGIRPISRIPSRAVVLRDTSF